MGNKFPLGCYSDQGVDSIGNDTEKSNVLNSLAQLEKLSEICKDTLTKRKEEHVSKEEYQQAKDVNTELQMLAALKDRILDLKERKADALAQDDFDECERVLVESRDIRVLVLRLMGNSRVDSAFARSDSSSVPPLNQNYQHSDIHSREIFEHTHLNAIPPTQVRSLMDLEIVLAKEQKQKRQRRNLAQNPISFSENDLPVRIRAASKSIIDVESRPEQVFKVISVYNRTSENIDKKFPVHSIQHQG